MSRLSTTSRRVLWALAAVTIAGFLLRLSRYQESVFGDELSTLYLTDGRSFTDVISLVSSNAEITPPFSFVLSWLALKLGSAPELVRLPSLIAGTLAIPFTFLLGERLVNRSAGLIAATVMALSPSMIFYSGDGRGYEVVILLLLGSTLAMLEAARGGRTRWWITYAVLSCLAMYTHYTAAFVLAAQLLWVLWAYPGARKAAILSNVGAAALFAPWVPSYLKDNDSPTLDILSALQGKTFAAKRQATEVWAIGYPFKTPREVPGTLAAVLGLGGFLAACGAAVQRFRSRPADLTVAEDPMFLKNVVLILALLLATPVLELVVWQLTDNDLYGARNLNTATVGLALLIGTVLVAAGRRWGAICAVAVIACFAIGAAKTLDTDTRITDFESGAEYIEDRAQPGDVVLDMLSPRVTPVPLTSLDAYLPQGLPEFRPLLPEGEPPFIGTSYVPPPAGEVRKAVRDANGGRLFLVTSDEGLEADGDEAKTILSFPFIVGSSPPERVDLPPGSRIVDHVRYPGIGPVNVYVIEIGRQQE
ncbi:MAG: glycosyltransferase family 39 protein [Solirubrobacterales bacterium]